jgi:hypothetical protein
VTTVTRLAYSDTQGSPITKTVLTVPSAQPIGTYLVAIVCSSGGGSTFTLVDSKSNTWTQREYASNTSSPSATIAIYTTPDAGLSTALTTSDTLSLTSTAGSGAGDILLVKVTPDVGETISYRTGGLGTGTGTTTPACTSFASLAGDLIISGLCESSATLNTQTTAGTGYTKLAGVDAHVQSRSCVGQYGSASGASTAPYTLTQSQPYATVAIALARSTPPPVVSTGVCAHYSYDSTTTKTINIPITTAVAAGQAIVGGVVMAGNSANTGMSITDSKGNSGWALADLQAHATPSSGQVFQIYNPGITTPLTTSDTINVTIQGNEIQSITEGGSGLTSYTLTYSGQTTGSIAAAASSATIVTALEALSNIGVGDVAVSGSAGGPYTVTFQGALANTNVSQMTATPTGGTGTVTIATVLGGGGVGSTQWAAKMLSFGGILAFDKSAHNTGTGTALNSGTTAAAAQNRQMVFAVFGGTGNGVTLDTLVPSGFTAETPQVTTTVVRNLWLVWGLVNSSGTRTVTAHMSDSASHAWVGTVGAYNSNDPVPNTVQWHLPDLVDGTTWTVDSEMVLASGSGWGT